MKSLGARKLPQGTLHFELSLSFDLGEYTISLNFPEPISYSSVTVLQL